ncbi:MAG: hypothetical protein ACTHU0_14870, partial [Kofleriaceae bacterium]
MSKLFAAVLGSLAASLATGCLDLAPDQISSTETHVESTNRLAANRLAANRLAANRLAANRLAANSLGASALLDTPDGREVLAYIVSCALPAGGGFVATALDGHDYVFEGSIGLAPGWATREPTVAERRWVTACVLSRTNLYGVSVQLSVRGGHEALATTNAERAAFTVVEGGFYGDLFDPTGPRLYACAAPPKVLGLHVSTLDLRSCAHSLDGATTECGFTYTGACAAVQGQKASCAGGEPYRGCASPSGAWDEVITTYLAAPSEPASASPNASASSQSRQGNQ